MKTLLRGFVGSIVSLLYTLRNAENLLSLRDFEPIDRFSWNFHRVFNIGHSIEWWSPNVGENSFRSTIRHFVYRHTFIPFFSKPHTRDVFQYNRSVLYDNVVFCEWCRHMWNSRFRKTIMRSISAGFHQFVFILYDNFFSAFGTFLRRKVDFSHSLLSFLFGKKRVNEFTVG